MTDLRKAAEMALKALEASQPVNYCVNNNGERFPMFTTDPYRLEHNAKAIDALRAALEQNPIEYYGHDGKHKIRIDPETGDVGIGS
jgi:hypothetical protein